MATQGQRARAVIIDDREVSLDTVVAVAAGARVEPSSNRAWRRRVAESRRVLDDALAAGTTVYGVSTGVGNNSSRAVGLPASRSSSRSPSWSSTGAARATRCRRRKAAP